MAKNITIPVKNIGRRNGTEVVQVYVRKADDKSGLIKTLRGFSRVDIKKGETKSVTINLPKTAFEFFDNQTNTMRTLPGDYELYYGNSSADKDLQKVTVKL